MINIRSGVIRSDEPAAIPSYVTPIAITVDTEITVHPIGTAPDHWYWDISAGNTTVMQVQTNEPLLQVDLEPSSEYVVMAVLRDIDGNAIGDAASAAFAITAPDVQIQTAGSISIAQL